MSGYYPESTIAKSDVVLASMIADYSRDLAPYTSLVISRAFDEARKTCEFFPKPKTIIELCEKITADIRGAGQTLRIENNVGVEQADKNLRRLAAMSTIMKAGLVVPEKEEDVFALAEHIKAEIAEEREIIQYLFKHEEDIATE